MSAGQLRYPSRLGERVHRSNRRDPVVWSKERAGPLSADELTRYERDGVLVLPGWISEPRAREWKRHAEELRADDRQERVFEKTDSVVRTIFGVDRSSDHFARIASCKRIVGIAEQILGSSVYVHQSRINFKSAFSGGDFWWHSDFEIWHTEDGMQSMRALTVAVMLDDNSEHNGPMLFVPHSHMSFLPCVNRTPDMDYKEELKTQNYTAPDRDLLRDLIPELGIMRATGSAGTVVVSDCNVLHGSVANMSPWPRTILFYCFNSVLNPLSDLPPLGTRPRPGYLANRDFSPLVADG